MEKKFKPDPALIGKPLQFPKGIYRRGQTILNMLRSDGHVQITTNRMHQSLKWGIGSLLDYLYEYNDKTIARSVLYGMLFVDDCVYDTNAPFNLTELIERSNHYKIDVIDNKIIFSEYYADNYIESLILNLDYVNNKVINQNTINNVKVVFDNNTNFLVFSFNSNFVKNPNYTSPPDGYTSNGEPYELMNIPGYPDGFDSNGAYKFVDFAQHPDGYIPDGYTSNGVAFDYITWTMPPGIFPDGFDSYNRPYMIIPNYEHEYIEVPVNPVSLPVSQIDKHIESLEYNYPIEKLLDADGNCILDEDGYRMTTRALDEFGKEYNLPRNPNESNRNYLLRLLAFTQEVSSICGFRKYVAHLLDITDDDIETEYIFRRFKIFETAQHYEEDQYRKSSFALNRLEDDNEPWMNMDEADMVVARDGPEVSNQLTLKLTIPCGFDLKWVYNQLVELLPIGVLLEVWDKCGNYYPSTFSFDLTMCTNNHVLANHSILVNGEKHELDKNGKFQSFNNDGDTFTFNVPGYHTPNSNLTNTGYFNYSAYISREIKGVMMVNPKESFVIQLIMKAIKKNEYMFEEV